MFRKALIFGIKILAKRLALEDYFVYRKARGLFNMIYMIKLITKMKLTQRNEAKDKKTGRSLLKFVFLIIDMKYTSDIHLGLYNFTLNLDSFTSKAISLCY